jgi:catechol 2,3-dioxygenase-like lactoylglutathione lyase family enzyme
MLGSSDIIAFAAAADLERARAFYQGVLGMRLVEQNEYACVFDANGTMLRVTAVPEVARPGYTVLGWRVENIRTLIAQLRAKGIAFVRYDGIEQDGDAIWTTPSGDMIAWFADPDGNTLSLTQFAA